MDTFVFFSVTQAYVFVCLLILTSRYFKKINKKNHVYIVYVIDKYTKDCSWIAD